MRIFIAGPLTDLADPQGTREFYKKLAEVVREMGHEPFLAYLNGTDPLLNPEVKPEVVYQIDTKELEKSDLMVAYIGQPSPGTGIEVEYAKELGIPVVILYENGKKVSRMLRGSPIIKKEIVFSSESDCLCQFRTFLQSLKV